jgi:hypothetical protein
MAYRESYAIPCWLYSRARKFFHIGMKPQALALLYQGSHARCLNSSKRVIGGRAMPRGFGTAFLECLSCVV